ncbi:MAG: hypothetical protein ACOY3D_05870 [Candidatus Omnitrophota bacterium]
MTKDEIYEHLAKVYLGKKKKRKKDNNLRFFTLLFINVITLPIVLALIVGAVNSSTSRSKIKSKNSLGLALNQYPLRINYDFRRDQPQIQNFSINLPEVNAQKFAYLEISLRGGDSRPRLVKIVLENRKKEQAAYYLSGVSNRWQKMQIPLNNFGELSDLSVLTKISFVFEAWNTDNQRGGLLVDSIGFSADTPPGNRL